MRLISQEIVKKHLKRVRKTELFSENLTVSISNLLNRFPSNEQVKTDTELV